MNPWILESAKKDTFFILMPGFIVFALLDFFNTGSTSYQLLAFFVFAFIDSGHVYTTLWRTYLNKEERDGNSIYLYVPLAIVSLMTLWVYFQVPYIWTFIFYATVYHHLRQYFGVLKWYEKLSKDHAIYSGRVLYVLCLLPVLASHFRSDLRISFYTRTDFLSYPNEELFIFFAALHASLLLLWLAYEMFSYKNGNFNQYRFFGIIFPMLLYSLVGYLAKNTSQVLMPLIIAHGIPYIAMMTVALKKGQPQKFMNYKTIIRTLLLTAAIFGALEFIFENYGPDLDNHYLSVPRPLLECLIVGLYLVPVLCHYYFDAVIWRRKHREASDIFS